MSKYASAVSQTFIELLFPEQIANEFMANPSDGSGSSEEVHSVDDGFFSIHNLPVTLNDISQEIPSRIQRDHPIENVIGQLGDGVKTRSQSGDVNTCLYSCFISQIEPKNVEMD